jgi:hypothetical protein
MVIGNWLSFRAIARNLYSKQQDFSVAATRLLRNDKLPFTIHQLLSFAVPTRFARLIAHAVLSNGLNSLEEKMAGAGAPEGLPLNFRFSCHSEGRVGAVLR